MSRFLVVVRPALVDGFRLAGVDAYAAEDIETAQELIEEWLEKDEAGLLAIDQGILDRMSKALMKRLEASEHLPYIGIPVGSPLGPEASRGHRIAQIIRQAIGFHITFKGEETKVTD